MGKWAEIKFIFIVESYVGKLKSIFMYVYVRDERKNK